MPPDHPSQGSKIPPGAPGTIPESARPAQVQEHVAKKPPIYSVKCPKSVTFGQFTLFLCYMFLHSHRPGTPRDGSQCPRRDSKTLRQAIRRYDLHNLYILLGARSEPLAAQGLFHTDINIWQFTKCLGQGGHEYCSFKKGCVFRC